MMHDAMTAAARDVLAERERQVSKEGWTPEHDDLYKNSELAKAAAVYATPPQLLLLAQNWSAGESLIDWLWPWSTDWYKPTTRRADLVKAGALILAEIERIDRAPTPAEHVQNFIGVLEQSRAANQHKE